MSCNTSNVIKVNSEEELKEKLKSITGPVVLDFVADWCGACKEDAPNVAKVACDNPEITVLKIDVDQAGPLADKFKVDALPTLYYAANATDALSKKKSREMVDAAALGEFLTKRKGG